MDGNSLREAIDSIIFSINMEFYQNLEFVEWSKKILKDKNCILLKNNPKGFYRSSADYDGKRSWVAFYDVKQINEALRKLANYFYKKEVTNENYI